MDLAPIAKTPLDRSTLVISGGVLKGGKEYSIRITGHFTGATSKGYAELAKFVNVPPSGGVCVTTPSEGYALKEIFSVRCEGWKDTEPPLRFVVL